MAYTFFCFTVLEKQNVTLLDKGNATTLPLAMRRHPLHPLFSTP